MKQLSLAVGHTVGDTKEKVLEVLEVVEEVLLAKGSNSATA